MFCTQNNVFEVLCSFGLEILRLRQDIKNPDILAYFGIFLRRINGKYQAKTDSSPSEEAPTGCFFNYCSFSIFTTNVCVAFSPGCKNFNFPCSLTTALPSGFTLPGSIPKTYSPAFISFHSVNSGSSSTL